jgi:hypothetical protein
MAECGDGTHQARPEIRHVEEEGAAHRDEGEQRQDRQPPLDAGT